LGLDTAHNVRKNAPARRRLAGFVFGIVMMVVIPSIAGAPVRFF